MPAFTVQIQQGLINGTAQFVPKQSNVRGALKRIFFLLGEQLSYLILCAPGLGAEQRIEAFIEVALILTAQIQRAAHACKSGR